MYIFGAQLQAKPGRGGELSAGLGALREAVSAAIGRPAYAWAVATGAPTGAFALSTRMEGTGDLIDSLMAVNTNEGYQKAAAALGDHLAAPSQTNWFQVVGTAGDVGEPKQVTVVTTATVATGQMSAAMGWCTEMMEYAAGLTGSGTMLTSAAGGSFFDVAFIGGFDSGQAADAANDAVAADAGYIERIDQAGDLFVNGSASRMVMVQLP
ncbi:MAG: hypothetical protein ACR2QO_19180 [Acidimicrobiales bacterium]